MNQGQNKSYKAGIRSHFSSPCRLAPFVFFFSILAAGLFSIDLTAKDPKLDGKTLLQNHLRSLKGEGSVLDDTRTASGGAQIQIILGGTGQMVGDARFLSAPDRLYYISEFDNPDYDREEFAYDGRRVHIGFHAPGSYTQLGNFLNVYDEMLKEGLLGGALSLSWPLLDEDEAASRLRYRGLKRIENRQLHEVDYQMRRGRNLRVKLYFEPETFHHVKTIYEVRTPAAQMGPTPEATTLQRRVTFKLEESFSEFDSFDGQTLPRGWVIQLSLDTGPSSSLWEWRTYFDSIEHGAALSDEDFALKAR